MQALEGHASGSAQMADTYAQADGASPVNGKPVNPLFPGTVDAGSVADRRTALRDVVGTAPLERLPLEVAPREYQWLLELLETMVAGCTYPAGDASEMDHVARTFDALADVIDEVTHVATRHGAAISDGNAGEAIDLFTQSFAKLAGGSGHLAEGAQACRGVAAYCRYTGVQIAWAKTNFLAACGYLLLLWGVARATATLFPVSTFAALSETGRVGLRLRMMLMTTGFRVSASGAAFMGGLAFVSDLTRKAYGLPADWSSVLTSAAFGAVSGGVTGKIHYGLGKAAAEGSELAEFLAHRVPGQLAVNTGVGFGLNVAGDVAFNHGDVNWTKDLGLAAGMAGFMAVGRVFQPAESQRADKWLTLSEEAFGPATTAEMTELAGANALPRLENLVHVLGDENHTSGLPTPERLREWTRNALGLPPDVPLTAYHVDSLTRVADYYKERRPGQLQPPGVRALHRFAATGTQGRSDGNAVQALGRLLRLHEVWHPQEPFDYWRHTGELVRLKQLTNSALGLGADTEVTGRHIETVLQALFGDRQTDIAPKGTSPIADLRRTDLSILLKAHEYPIFRNRGATLATFHELVGYYWDLPPDQIPTPAHARALARLWATVPGTTQSGIAQELLGLDREVTMEEMKGAGHTLSLAMDLTRGTDWPQVARYFTPTRQLEQLVRSEYGIPQDEILSPQQFHDYARDLLNEHGMAPPAGQHISRTLMDAALIVDFYGLDKEAANAVEHRFMLGEVAHLHELIRAEWPKTRGFDDGASIRTFEPVAEKLTGSADPYELLKLYRQVKFDSPDGLVHSIKDLAKSEHATGDAFTDWDKFDAYEYTLRNYVGERVPAVWTPPEGVIPGRWEPGNWKPRILGHDIKLINAIYSILKTDYGVHPGEFKRFLDVASGTNPYPSLTFGPLLSEDGYVEKLVYEANQQEIDYNNVKYGPGDGIYRNTDRYGIPQEIDTRKIAEPWGEVVKAAGTQHFPGQAEHFERPLDRDMESTRLHVDDIFTFDSGHGDHPVDIAAEFYASDSMSTKWAVAAEFRGHVIRAVRPGGYVVFGNVLNLPAVKGGEAGHGYTAGRGTRFPNIAYDRERWQQWLDAHPRVESYRIFESRDESSSDQFSAGEDGIGLFIIKLVDDPPDAPPR
ncbi:WXG100-like domain-containing protein [Actinoallomurus bryophytorum]